MTEPIPDTEYGVLMASNESLVVLASSGSEFARRELRRRLPERMSEVLSMYRAAYSDVEQIDAIMAALADMKRIVGISAPE